MSKFRLYLVYISTLLIVALDLSAQNKTISGSVKDAVTLQPVIGSSISLLNTTTGTTANTEGKFMLAIPAHIISARIAVSSLSYAADTIEIFSTKSHYDILLKPTSGALGEVVVTGVSKATLIRENPIPVSVVSAKKIEQSAESNIIDVFAKNVPGLNVVKTGPNISKPFIRGLGYNRVLTLYDGVRQEGQQWGDEHGLEVDAFNIEKGEVIKGPSSLIYGSDAVAGVVSLFPVMPQHEDKTIKGKFFSEHQTNNGLYGNGLRLTYGSSRWSVALRGSYRIAKNYRNNIDGAVFNTGFRETNASASIRHTSEKGSSVLNFTLYNNLQGVPDGSRDSTTRKFTKQIFEGNADDVKSRPVVSDEELNSYRLSPLHQHIQHLRLYLNNHYELGKGDVTFLLGLQQNFRREYNHPTLPRQAGMFIRLNTVNYSFSYNAPTIANTDVTAGFNGMYQNNRNKSATDFPIPDYHLFDAGVYIHAKWKQNNWTVSGGLRYDTRILQGRDFYTNSDAVTGFARQVNSPDTSGAYLQFAAFKKVFTGISMSLGSTYQLNPHISFKANIARGYRAPNITEFASNGLDPGAHIVYLGNRNFSAEFSLQQDIGADITYKDFSFSASVFHNYIQNYIYLTQVSDVNGAPITDAQGNKTYQYAQSAAQLYGAEGTATLHLLMLKGFSFENSFSVIYGNNKKEAYKNKGLNGEYLPLIPPLKLLSSLSQAIQTKYKIIEAVSFKAEAEINAAQNRYLALNETEKATPGYSLFNFSITTQVKYNKENELQLQLQVNNLLDKAYQSNLSRLRYFEYYSHSLNGHYGIYNMGRNFSFKLIMSF